MCEEPSRTSIYIHCITAKFGNRVLIKSACPWLTDLAKHCLHSHKDHWSNDKDLLQKDHKFSLLHFTSGHHFTGYPLHTSVWVLRHIDIYSTEIPLHWIPVEIHYIPPVWVLRYYSTEIPLHWIPVEIHYIPPSEYCDIFQLIFIYVCHMYVYL